MDHKPYIIVLGNEKGGTGKSTVAMHIIISLLKKGHSVISIDIDARQGTLSRYLNHRSLKQTHEGKFLLPDHHDIFPSTHDHKHQANQEDEAAFLSIIHKAQNTDYIVIDTPGSNTFLSRFAHSFADTLITPLNDSFIDLDMLVKVNGDTMNIINPSTYAEMVWEQKKQRAIRDGRSIEWIVMRNRLSSINSKNKEEMEKILQALSKRIGFRLIAGFGERVIFRELFLSGLTLLDLREANTTINVSHLAAKQELSDLMNAIMNPEPSQRRSASL